MTRQCYPRLSALPSATTMKSFLNDEALEGCDSNVPKQTHTAEPERRSRVTTDHQPLADVLGGILDKFSVLH